MLVVQKQEIADLASRLLNISKGMSVIVDADLYDWLNKFYWRAVKSSSGFYAVTRRQRHNKVSTIRMHRLIMHAPDWMKVHHINHNTLDNRRSNLQLLTEREHRHFDGWHIFRA